MRILSAIAMVSCVGITACSSNLQGDDATRAESEPLVTGGVPTPAVQTAISGNRPMERQLNLLVRIVLDDGNMVEFYEPAPGHLLFSAAAAGGTPLAQRVPGYRSIMRASDLYAALQPNSPIPAALSDADKRVAALQAREAGAPPPENGKVPISSPGAASPKPSVTPVTSAGASANASCGYCDVSCFSNRECAGQTGDYTWCFAQAHDGAYADDNDNDNDGSGVLCAQAGYPVFTLKSDVYYGSWNVPVQTDRSAWTNECEWYPWICGDQSIRFTGTGGGGDVFGFAGEFTDSDP